MDNTLINILTIDRFETDENWNPIKTSNKTNELVEIMDKQKALTEISKAKKAFEESAKRGEIEIIDWIDDIKTDEYWEFILKFKSFGLNKMMSFKVWRNASDK